MYRGRTAAEGGVGPVSPSQNDVIKHARIVKKGIAANGYWPDKLLGEPSQPVSRFACFSPKPAREVFPLRQVEEPLRCLNPGHVRVTKVAQRVAEQSGEDPGIGIANDQEITVGLLKSVSQVTGLKANIGLAGDVVCAFLIADGFHLRTPAIIEHVHLVVQRAGVIHLHGVPN